MDHGYCWKIVKVSDYDEVCRHSCIQLQRRTNREPRMIVNATKLDLNHGCELLIPSGRNGVHLCV